jgi:hypothetical protein
MGTLTGVNKAALQLGQYKLSYTTLNKKTNQTNKHTYNNQINTQINNQQNPMQGRKRLGEERIS